MSRNKKAVLLAAALALIVLIAVPLAWFTLSTMPSLFASLNSTDSGAVFIGVAGAFGLSYALAIPRTKGKSR